MTRWECPEHGVVSCSEPTRDGKRWCVLCLRFSMSLIEYVPKDALAAALVAGVEVAGKVRDANQAERRRLEGQRDAVRMLLDRARRYVKHSDACAARTDATEACGCGLRAWEDDMDETVVRQEVVV
jgi:hypothetical protein